MKNFFTNSIEDKMKLYKILTFLIVAIIAFTSFGYAKPRIVVGGNPIKYYTNSPAPPVVQRIILNANNIAAYFQNTGIFDQNTTSGNTAGFEWPKGSGKYASFTAGLCIGCYITDNNGTPKMAQVMASYKGEYSPGAVKRVSGLPAWDNDSKFKMYTVRNGDNSSNNPDYDKWSLMIPYGAPYEDVNNNGMYDQGIDVPGQKNAGQTIFLCMTDADASNRSSGEGFGGGVNSPLLYAEVHFTAWCYNTPGLEDLQFVNWIVINKGDSAWRRTYTGVVVDPDLGDANDDYIGCDTVNKINLGFCYNGDNNDSEYGAAPPAFGMDYFKSPIVRKPGLPNDTLGLTSFSFFTNTSTAPPACESDPNGESYPAYLNLKGVKKDGSPYLDPTQSPPVQTKYCYPGDPETGSGWTELKGSVQNCGGLTGTVLTTNPKGDRRFIFCSGREDFVFNPGDTQNIVLAQFVARGSSNLNSVTRLKSLAKTAKLIYLSDFNVTPPPPGPVVNASFTPLPNGQCNINLNWDDKAETYKYWDTIFFKTTDSNIYAFEGYELYEINKFANSMPDFTKPETIDLSAAVLLDTYDKKNDVGYLIDTFSTGVTINNQEQFAPYPIVPPYKMPAPASFPNIGLKRGVTLTGTKFTSNYGGMTNFIYGQEYHFAVVAYAVSKSTKIKRGFRVIRNSLSAQIIKIRPTMPPAGTVYTLKNGDTLNTSWRDLGCMPIVRNQDLLLNATYRIIFNPLNEYKDTTYNILRKIDGAANFETVKSKLRYSTYIPTSDDSSRTVDGLLIKVQKIRYLMSGTKPDGSWKVGVIKDVSSTMNRDSTQARLSGWEYKPADHQFVTGSKYRYYASVPWQSLSMSLAYPSKNVFINLESKLPPERIRKVKIVFSNTNKQYAYRYYDTLDASGLVYWKYQNLVQVPFKVYESEYTDSTATDVQLNCGFIENGTINPATGQFNITADSLGGKLIMVIFGSQYDTSKTDYKYNSVGDPLNLFTSMPNIDLMYAWAPKLVRDGATFVDNDEFWIYPYGTITPYIQGNLPFYYEFHVTAPKYGDVNVASSTGALEKIRVVPNPYYGFSTLDRSASDKFVTFRNLPLQCTIKIYTLNGDLIRTLVKSSSGNTSTSSTLEWNLQNMEKTPVASGIYIALVDAPGIGQKVIKIAIFTSQERINF